MPNVTQVLKPIFAADGKVIYKTGSVYNISAQQGTILSDHSHDEAETIWLIYGEAEIQIGEVIERAKAPCEFYVGPKVYHKFTAITDINFVEERHSS